MAGPQSSKPQTIGTALATALAHHRAGRLNEAVRLCRAILAARPEEADARHLLGLALYRQHRLADAEGELARAAALRPEAAPIHTHHGAVLGDLGRTAEAVAALERALALTPDNADALRNLGVTWQEAGRYPEAEAAFARWVAARPDDAAAHLALARTMRAQGRHANARDHFVAAIRRAPEDAEAHWDIALAHITLGDFAAGWDAYRWRWRLPAHARTARLHPQPGWTGDSLPLGHALLLWGEQGVGDTVMFAACIPDAATKATDIAIEVEHRLVPLLARSFPAARVVAATEPPQPATRAATITAQAPLGDLPALFRRTEGAFPRHAGWLVPDPGRAGILRRRYEKLDGTRRIGVTWRSANPASGPARSLAPGDLAPLAALDDIAWISLQYGATSDDIAALRAVGMALHVDSDIEPGTDLDGHAAQIAALDAIVTIENATAHFAGALGRPGLVLLSFVAGAYWGTGRDDSPWYPSLRLLRQPEPGAWAPVIAAAATALRDT